MGKTFDVREGKEEKITKIIFSGSHEELSPNTLVLSESSVYLKDDDICDDNTDTRIFSKQQATDLIRALEKAISLGWFDE